MRLVVAFALTVFASSAFSQSEPPQVELVRKLYKSFAWEAIMHGKNDEDLVSQPKAVLEGYFDSAMVDLIHREDVCRHGELCALEFNPLFDTQDPFLHDLSVEKAAKSDDVVVGFKHLDGTKEKKITIRFQMSKGKSGWRISDLVYAKNLSLKQILSTNP